MPTTGTVALAAEVKPLYSKKRKKRAKKKPTAAKKVVGKITKRG